MRTAAGTCVVALLALAATGTASAQIGFGKSELAGTSSNAPSSLQFGPDGRLYVAHRLGVIKIYTVKRNGENNYDVTATETITAIQNIPNHNDDGSLNNSVQTRQVTGLLVAGSANNPVIYVTSSDPRVGGGSSGEDLNLDTNSGIVSRLTMNANGQWQRLDLVRGLPRSEENHSPNGLELAGGNLFVAIGGHTNKGAPSEKLALLPEYALSAAILKIDLSQIGNTTYNLPTLDDEDDPGADANEPFGGNDGKNQAKLVPNGPVQIHATGFRNPYDIVITSSGRMYTIDNGANQTWGDVPANEGPGGNCTNAVQNGGTTDLDSLHFITGSGYYGGHPNPTRANTANKFNSSNPQSPVPAAAENPVECDYRQPGNPNGALTLFQNSTNGIAEYRASNFGNAMKGNLIAASLNSNLIFRLDLNAAGTAVTTKQELLTAGVWPLDVTAQGDGGKFPGTIWVADIAADSIFVYEPNDFGGGGGPSCSGNRGPADEDGDGYSNADELDNGTDPCSAGSTPPDWDRDDLSNLNDRDDDNDGRRDTSDPFAIDRRNGTRPLPVRFTFAADAPRPRTLLGLGFTGLMTNGRQNYERLFDPAQLTAGGAAGVLTVDNVPAGDALGNLNSQKYGFQFGVAAPARRSYTAHTRILGPFEGENPQDHQSLGLFLGSGNQDNYLKVVLRANGGSGGIHFLKEKRGRAAGLGAAALALPGPDAVDLYITVRPRAGTVQASYALLNNGVRGPRTNVGPRRRFNAGWLEGGPGLAVGIISTSRGAPPFAATWDLIEIRPGT